MEIDTIMKYVSYLLTAIGVMAFLVSAITQVIKSWPKLDSLPTAAVVIALSLILCPLTFMAVMAWQQKSVTWYMLVACMIVACIVALIAMDGWEKVTDIWTRTHYKKQ